MGRGGPSSEQGDRREGESRDEQLDRNYGELLQELRVAQTGTQILFAFLLTVAFSPAFGDEHDDVHAVYGVTLVLCAVATALLIAPVAVHRIVFRQGLKDRLVSLSNVCALSGVYVLLLAVTGALFIALSTVVQHGLAVLVAGAVALLTVGLWVVLPLVLRVQEDRRAG